VHRPIQLLRVVLFAAFATAASASNLVIQTTPDAFVSELAVDFTSGQLTVTGFANSFTDTIAGQITLLPITSGSFALSATIDSNGVASGGALTLTGFIYDDLGAPLYPPYSGTLLSGTLSSLSFDQTADSELDFQFSFLSGDLQPLYGPSAILKMNLFGFPGTFNADFSTSDFSNVADVGIPIATPEPATWALMALGALSLAFARCERALR
jgi:hypothetical protein